MLWFWLSITAALLWSINNHLDKYLYERYYRDSIPGALMFLSAGLGGLFALVILVVHPVALTVPLPRVALLLLAGVLDFCYIFPYIHALMRDEASRVAPLFQVGPIFSFILAWVFLHEHLSVHELLAAITLIGGAFAINLDLDNGLRFKKDVFGLMLVATGLFSLETFLFKYGALHVGFWSGAFYQYLGACLSGLVLAIISRKYRQAFLGIIRANHRSVFTLSLTAEVLSTTARVSLNYASLLAPLALVTSVANTQPFFVIAIGILLTIFAPKFGKESITGRHLVQKLACSVIIFIGTYALVH
jgi:drug/metabolite transporter (DMT)-like permease